MDPSSEPSTGYVAAFGSVTILAMFIVRRLISRIAASKSADASPESKVVGAGALRGLFADEKQAIAVCHTGDVLAVFLVGAAVVKNCLHGGSLMEDVIWCAAFAGLGLLLLELTGLLGVRVLLKRRLRASIKRGNLAAATAAAAHFVATGLITSRAVAGSDLKGVGLSLTFFALAIFTHQIVVALFRMLTTYDDSEQIEGENLAAAISYGGLSLAVAIIVSRALEGGDFPGWAAALSGFGLLSATALGLFPIRQIVVQWLVLGGRPSLRGGALDDSIGRDRNAGVAAVEAASYVGAALAVVLLA